MKKKKGFTLIELLAIIVILAIIALIAVPVILNILDKANKSAFKDTAYGILSVGELYFTEQQLELGGMTKDEVTFELPAQANTKNGIQIKGEVPNGILKVNKEGKVAFALYNGRYCAKKEYTENDIIIIEDLDGCNFEVPTISELESHYNFNYYSSLARAVTDVNNDGIGVNSNNDREGAVAGVYETNGHVYVVLLQDTTEETTLQISSDMTLNLGGHKLTTTDTSAVDLKVGNLVIDGRLEGGVIEKTNVSTGIAALVTTAVDTGLTVNGGTYSINNDGRADCFNINGNANFSNAVINVNSAAGIALGVYVLGNATISDCDISVTSETGNAYAVYVKNNATISDSEILALSPALGSAVCGICGMSNSNTVVSNCNIKADGFSDYVPEGETAAKAVSVYAIITSESATITINDGYYWGAREALGINGTARINGGVYEGCQHGGAYLSGSDIKVKNAVFRNVDYTGDVGWISTNWHGGAVYCGSGSNAVNVYFDNCRFESDVRTVQGIVAKYTNTTVYLSNSVTDGDFDTVLRVDHPTNYLYIGENVSCDTTSFVGNGHLDTTTYAGEDFGNW